MSVREINYQKKKIDTTSVKKTKVSNEAVIDAVEPIPFASKGYRFSSNHDTEYLPFLGNQADFGQTILEARLLSATHSACINTKGEFIAGQGFIDINNKDIDEGIADWFKCVNLKSQSVSDINKAIQESYLTFGNVPIELVRVNVAGERRLYIYVHNFLECKLSTPNADDICEKVLISKQFNNGNPTLEQVDTSRELPLYNKFNSEEDNWKYDEGDENVSRTMIWYKNEVAGIDYYGLPSSIASLIYQILEYKGARYNLDNFENNMIIDAFMFLKGNLSQEEANKIGKGIRKSHTGDGKRGRVAVFASEEGIEDVVLKTLDTHKDGSYIEADNKWSDKIILANEWDAILAGIVAPSSLGKGSGYLTKIIEWKMSSVIKPAQKELMDKVWNIIFDICEKHIGLPFRNYNLKINNAIDISGLTDVDITEAVQINEVREARGLPKDGRREGEYLKGNKTSTDYV